MQTLRRFAEMGDLDSQLRLAEAYWKGQGVGQSYDEAFKYYRMAAEQGDSEAQRRTAYCYNYGIGTVHNEDRARYWYEKAAEQDNPGALFALAVMAHMEYDRYEKLKYEGLFLSKNEELENSRLAREKYFLASDLYARAAELGDDQAQGELEKMRRGRKIKNLLGDVWIDVDRLADAGRYYAGENNAEDIYDGLIMLDGAKDEGSASAEYLLDDIDFVLDRCGILMESGISIYVEYSVMMLERLCNRGVDAAMMNMAYYYSSIVSGAPDNRKVFKYVLQAAECGNPDAQNKVSFMYYTGTGTATDTSEALRWRQKAAANNIPSACYMQALEYLTGENIAPDAEKAFTYMKKAADQGIVDAVLSLGELYLYGVGTEEDHSLAFSCFKTAERTAEKPEADMIGARESILGSIQLNLALCYFKGTGVQDDREAARYYFEKASRNGLNGKIKELCEKDSELEAWYYGNSSPTIREEVLMYSKIAGITYDNRQQYARNCCVGQELGLERDKYNMYDTNAVAVYDGYHQLGFIPKETARTVAQLMDSGTELKCYVENINYGGTSTIGINIRITKIVKDAYPVLNRNSSFYYDDDDDHRSEGFYLADDGRWYEEGDEPDYYEDEY